MPCYDERNSPGYVVEEVRKDCRHNSDVAELLCYVLSDLPQGILAGLTRQKPELHVWWQEHQRRDAAKKASEDRAKREAKAAKEINDLTKQLAKQIRKKHGL